MQLMIEQSKLMPASLENVERLFAELALLYGSRLASLWSGQDPEAIKRRWAEALAGFQAREVKAGLEACRVKSWPPTLPEFLLMCREPVDYEFLFEEAQKQVWLREKCNDMWPHPAVYWTAVEFGFFELKNASWRTAKEKWKRILSGKRAIQEELPPVPAAVPSLPLEGKAFTNREEARKHISNLKAILAGEKNA